MAEKDRFRKKMIHVKLTEEENAILEQNTFELDMSKSEFIRQIILYGRLTENVISMDKRTEEALSDLQYEVNKVGVNINQIAYLCNVKQFVSADEIVMLKEQLLDLLERVTEKVISLESGE